VRYSGHIEGETFWMEYSVVWWIGINVLRIFAASIFSSITSALSFSHIAVVMIERKQSNGTQSMVQHNSFFSADERSGTDKIIEGPTVRKGAQGPNCIGKIFHFLIVSLFVDCTN